MKVMSKTDWDMETESIQSNKPPIKVSGLMAKNMERAKSYSRVDRFSKDNLLMILNRVMEKCIIIPPEIILRENGKTTRNKDKEPWIGLIFERNMLDNGRIIIRKAGACIYGWNLKVKASI